MEIPFLNHWIIFSLIGLLACLYILVTFNPLAERINGHISQLPICALKNITPVLVLYISSKYFSPSIKNLGFLLIELIFTKDSLI